MSHRPKVPPPPQPTRIHFDPYNSSSTGHQVCPSSLSRTTSWRQSRSHKLSHQFGDATGRGGKEPLSDLVGAGSNDFQKDGRKENGDWEVGAPGLREKGWQDISTLFNGSRKRKSEDTDDASGAAKKRSVAVEMPSSTMTKNTTQKSTSGPPTTTIQTEVERTAEHDEDTPITPRPQIFRGLTIYLNGSTAPLISDHRLKQLFAQHGGNSSITLGRRTVTHVILGSSCGGGLASGKIQKEVKHVGGKGIRYVTAQWVIDSVEKGVRQAEGRYTPGMVKERIGGCGQRSVRDQFTPAVKIENG